MNGGLFSQYVNILSGRKVGAESGKESPNNPIDLMFKDGIENVTLEMVLTEQEVVNACKWGNQKLEKFFTREMVRQMLKLIVEMPPDGCSKQRGHKMPFVANEIFSCELTYISSKFFTPEVIDEKEFVDYAMTPVSSFAYSCDSEKESFQVSEFKEVKKPHLEINFNDDCEVEMADFSEQMIKNSESQIREAFDEESVEQFQVVNETETSDKKYEESNNVDAKPFQLEDQKNQNDTLQTDTIKQNNTIITQEPVFSIQLQNKSRSQTNINSPLKVSPIIQIKEQSNRFELFEDFLSFLDTANGTVSQLNSVLCGYFCNLFKVLVGSHAKEVFYYIYKNQQVIEKLVNHIYQPAICEVVSRLLNFNQTVFSDDQSISLENQLITEKRAQEIRSNTVFAIMERLGPDYGLEHKLGALQLLKELPNSQNLSQLLTSTKSMQKMKDFLQTEDQDVKSCTFQFLSYLVFRYFPSNMSEASPQKVIFRPVIIKNPFEEYEEGFSQEATQELTSSLISENFFEFLTLVVIEVIPFVLRLDQQESVESFVTQYNMPQKRLGMVRLHALEFLDLVQSKLGARMRIQLKEADIYSLIIEYFEAFPFNDFALQKVFSIISTAIDGRYEKPKPEKDVKIQNIQTTEPADQEQIIIDDETRLMENQILIHLLFQTSLINKIISLPRDKSKLKFSDRNLTEMGYMAYLIELGQMLALLSEKNVDIQEYLLENPEWEAFVDQILKIKIERRKGALYDDPRFPKADPEEANFISRLVGNFKIKSPTVKRNKVDNPDDDDVKLSLHKSPLSGSRAAYCEDENNITSQEDMDRLIQPYLSFEDDDEELKEGFQVNEVENQQNYDINKYSSNETARNKPIQSLNYQDDEEQEEENESIMKLIELKEKQRANNSRYSGFGQIKPLQQKKKTSEVLGVTGVDFDSDEEEQKEGRYANNRLIKDDDEDDDIERDESLSMDHLDGWIEKINEARRKSPEEIIIQQKSSDQDIGPGQSDDHQFGEEDEDFDFITEHFKRNQNLNKNDTKELQKKDSFGTVLQRYDSEFEQFEVNQEYIDQEPTILKQNPALPQNQDNLDVAKVISNDNFQEIAIEVPVIQKFLEQEQTTEYFQNFYWKLPVSEEDQLDDLLQDYQ